MALVLFDIDGTLVTGAGTERGLFRHMLLGGRIGPAQLLAFMGFAVRHAGEYGADVFRKDKAWLAGLEIAEVEACAAEWVHRCLPARWFRPAIERLNLHLERGDRVALLSGTPDFVANAIGRELGVTEVVASRCATGAGRFSAGPPLSHPFAAEKLRYAAEIALRHGEQLADVVAYADSVHDLALLRAVGTPVAVRPDRRLRAAARAAGWEILGSR